MTFIPKINEFIFGLSIESGSNIIAVCYGILGMFMILPQVVFSIETLVKGLSFNCLVCCECSCFATEFYKREIAFPTYPIWAWPERILATSNYWSLIYWSGWLLTIFSFLLHAGINYKICFLMLPWMFMAIIGSITLYLMLCSLASTAAWLLINTSYPSDYRFYTLYVCLSSLYLIALVLVCLLYSLATIYKQYHNTKTIQQEELSSRINDQTFVYRI